jgi:hypothetical protein
MVEPTEGIFLTGITAPETGWSVAYHCRHCRKTVFMLNVYAAKPKDGDYWLMEMCADNCSASLAEILGLEGVFIDDAQWARMVEQHRA